MINKFNKKYEYILLERKIIKGEKIKIQGAINVNRQKVIYINIIIAREMMFDLNDSWIMVQMCKFEALVQRAHVVVKFPCSYFVEWKTINNRYSICSQKRVRTANDEAVFNQKLTFYTQMVYNTKKKQYYSKETFLLLNLVSKSRPDQVKLVGRISIDLADVLNRRRFQQLSRIKLNYCSVEGSVVFSISLLNKRDSNLTVKDLDRSAFTDYFSLNPINRIMIEESINNHPFNNNSGLTRNDINKKNNKSLENAQKNQQQNQNITNSHQSAHNKAPSFTVVEIQQQRQFQAQTYQRSQQKHVKGGEKEEEIIWLRNYLQSEAMQKMEKGVSQSPRTNNSRERSLIEKLEETNFRNYQKNDNVVDFKNKQPKTDRMAGDSELSINIPNSETNVRVHTNKALNRIHEQQQDGQKKKQQAMLNKVSSQTRITSRDFQPVNLLKPTSPPSHERQLTHQNSSSKYSETSESQNEQLLSIVEKLQQQKQQQQSMIQSLKSMLLNRNMKKKEEKAVVEDLQLKNRQKQVMEENAILRVQNGGLSKLLEEKQNQLRQKSMHELQLLDKIAKIQMKGQQEKIQWYSGEAARLTQDQNKKQYEWGGQSQLRSKAEYKGDPLESENQQPCKEQQQPFRIKITRDETVIEEIERDNLQLGERVKQLEKEIEVYKQLISQHNQPCPNPMEQSVPIEVSPEHVILDDEVPFKITVSKNANVYQNYQNLEHQNTELYHKITLLEHQILTYKDLIKHQNYPQNRHHSQQKKVITETPHVHQFGQFTVSLKEIHNVAESQLPTNISYLNNQHQLSPFETTSSPTLSQKDMNLVAQTFRIILTKDKNIYKQQEEQNIELSKRVIELEQQMDKYKDLIKVQNLTNQEKGRSQSNENYQGVTEKQNHYENEGLIIKLSKDKNIFQNQEKQLSQLQLHAHQLQQTVQKYKFLYGPLEKEPRYKISITREENIYEDQERQLKELLKILDQKDDEVLELTSRLSLLERELQEYKPKNDNQGEIRITIKREENIYEEQEKEIRELATRVIQLEDKLSGMVEELKVKELHAAGLQNQLKILRAENQGQKLSFLDQRHLSKYSANQLQSSSTNQYVSCFNSLPLSVQTHKPTAESSCLACVRLQNRVTQVETNIQLIQEQKTLLQEQIGALEEEKFCMTSTQNELKITIEDLRDEINLLGQQNERLAEEVYFFQQNYHLQKNQKDRSSEYQPQFQHQHHQREQQQNPQQVVNQSKFTLSLPQKILQDYNNADATPIFTSKPSTRHLQELPKSDQNSKNSKKQKSVPQSPRASQVIYALQEQNTHLRQSLSRFQEQLQEQQLTIGELEQRIARLMHEKEILFERDQELSKQIILLSGKQHQINERQIVLRERISELEKQLMSFKSQSLTTINTSNFQKDESADKARITQLQNEVKALRAQLQMARQSLALEENSGWLLREKEQQIQELEKQLYVLNQSLCELSMSYQSLQKNMMQLQEQKQSEVQNIREEHEAVNRMLKEELQAIEKVIGEKQKICEQNEIQLRARGQQIEQLIAEIDQLRAQTNHQAGQQTQDPELILQQNQRLQAEIHVLNQNLKNIKEQQELVQQKHQKLSHLEQKSKQEIQLQFIKKKVGFSVQKNHDLLKILELLKLSKQQRDQLLVKLVPLISERLNQTGFPQNKLAHEEPLARLISKEVQKIKIKIMKNHQNGSQSLNEANAKVADSKNEHSKVAEFKMFAEKSAMLSYLKPLQDLIIRY